jgi:hypothetical protein
MSVETVDRIRDLESRIEELENRKPLRGDRGPAGDITACLENVKEQLPGMVKDELRRLRVVDSEGVILGHLKAKKVIVGIQ